MSTLYICYLGIEEPLVQTQVIPYLEGLASAGYSVALLTFEPRRLSANGQRARRESLRARGIEWHALRYHKRPALPATIADIVSGIVYGTHLVRTRRISVVHARGHVPAAMALTIRWLLGTRFVFDVRGLMAEEYVDAGLWKPGGFLFRLVKRLENIFLSSADAAVVLTRRAHRSLIDAQAARLTRIPIEVIPCCVDLPRFHVEASRAQDLRSNLGLGEHPVLVYAGKFGGWYMAREMTEFFCVARQYFPDLHFLVLTQSAFNIIEGEFARRGITREDYLCLTVSPEEIPEYLALADFAICFITPCSSKIASSPTKMGEYLAAGLSVVYNSGIGDLDDLEEEQVGVVVGAFCDHEYARAAREMQRLLQDRTAAAFRCREAARRHYGLATIDIPRYCKLYSAVFHRQIENSVPAQILGTKIEVAGRRGTR